MKPLNILTINPPAAPLSPPSILIEPIDTLAAATWLQALGHNVTILDFNRRWPGTAGAAAAMAAACPDLVVIPFDYHIPLYSTAAAAQVTELTALARRLQACVILGGKPAAFYPEDFIKQEGVAAICGEMEPALAELSALAEWRSASLRQIAGIAFLDGARVVRTAPRRAPIDMDRLPRPDRALLDLRDYIDVRTILSSRGCIERCAFCPVRCFWGTWRGRRPAGVADELQYLIEACQARKILFLDDHALGNPARMLAVCAEIQRRGLKAALGCLATPSSFDRRLFARMFEAGFRWVHFGAESGSNAVLRRLNKRVTVDQIRRAVAGAKALGFRVRTSWILDAPGTDREGLDQTMALIAESRSHEIRLHFLALRAGAPLAAGLERLPEQYIHAAAPHSGRSGLSPELIAARTAELIAGLKDGGYQACGLATDWARLAAAPDPRFVSFGPSRYGLAWEGGAHA